MNIIMLGAPGSGKGTVGIDLCEKFGFETFSTGAIFREEIENETELGKLANEYISSGALVPDDVTIKIVEKGLEKYPNGAIFDGFPRTIAQAEALKEMLAKNGKKIDLVLNLSIPDEDIIVRTASRLTCPNKKCGATFNSKFMPPKLDGICDRCGSKLVIRSDDKPETIKKRLSVYHENTEPLIDFYKNEGILETIDIDIYKDSKEDNVKRAIAAIEKHK